MFGEDFSESPRLPSPWAAVDSPLIEPSTPAGADLDLLSISLASSCSFEEAKEDMVGGGLVPESDACGNVEYKLKLARPAPERFARLVTQLQWRLFEGGGEAIYEIGVLDDGTLVGLCQSDLDESLAVLDRMAAELGATVILNRQVPVDLSSTKRTLPAVPPGRRARGRLARLVHGECERGGEADTPDLTEGGSSDVSPSSVGTPPSTAGAGAGKRLSKRRRAHINAGILPSTPLPSEQTIAHADLAALATAALAAPVPARSAAPAPPYARPRQPSISVAAPAADGEDEDDALFGFGDLSSAPPPAPTPQTKWITTLPPSASASSRKKAAAAGTTSGGGVKPPNGLADDERLRRAIEKRARRDAQREAKRRAWAEKQRAAAEEAGAEDDDDNARTIVDALASVALEPSSPTLTVRPRSPPPPAPSIQASSPSPSPSPTRPASDPSSSSESDALAHPPVWWRKLAAQGVNLAGGPRFVVEAVVVRKIGPDEGFIDFCGALQDRPRK